MPPVRSICSLLTSPCKVAHALDWRKPSGRILNLAVRKNRMELAVASHPCCDEPLRELSSIPLETKTVGGRKVLESSVVSALRDIVRDHKVCGLVVNWPVEKEGQWGGRCGRVLHALDMLVAAKNNNDFLGLAGPICLWDHSHNESPEDEWGRWEGFSRTTDKTVHIASKEQFQDNETTPLDIWNDFCRKHWPEFEGIQKTTRKPSLVRKERVIEEHDRSASSLVADLSWIDWKNTRMVQSQIA